MKHVEYAIYHTKGDAAKTFSDVEIEKDYKDINGRTALHWLCGNKEGLKKSDLEGCIKIFQQNMLDEPNLAEAYEMMLKEERAKLAKVNKTLSVVKEGVKSLIKAGYDPNAKDDNGQTPKERADAHGCGDAYNNAIEELKAEGHVIPKPLRESVAGQHVADFLRRGQMGVAPSYDSRTPARTPEANVNPDNAAGNNFISK